MRLLLICTVFALSAVNVPVWNAVLLFVPHTLSVSFLDIGQGDAILVRGPTGRTLLIDGGPDNSVIRELPHEIGIFKEKIDAVAETHPDKDHIAGLIGVFEKYEVNHFLTPGIPDKTAIARALRDAVTSEPGIHTTVLRRGMRLHLGGAAYADILYPDRDQSTQTETNTGSVAMRIVYRKTSFMLTGDLPSSVEEYLVALDHGRLQSNVLKAGHHGSKTSSSELWLATVQPAMVAISAGKGNSYKHPNPEVIERIQKQNAQIVSTIEGGTLRFRSDGNSISLETQR